MVLNPAVGRVKQIIQQQVVPTNNLSKCILKGTVTQPIIHKQIVLLSPHRRQTLDSVCFVRKRKGTNLTLILFPTEAWRSFRQRDEVSCLWFIRLFDTRSVCESVCCVWKGLWVNTGTGLFELWLKKKRCFVEWDKGHEQTFTVNMWWSWQHNTCWVVFYS